MKINEFKTPSSVDEGLGDAFGGAARALVGDRAVSSIKGAFTGKGTKEQLTQDLFFKDFINDAATSLNNAVKSKLVNPNIQASLGKIQPPITPASQNGPAANPLTAPTLQNKNVTATVNPSASTSSGGGITTGGIGYSTTPTVSKPKVQPTSAPKASPAPAAPITPKPAGPSSAQQTVDAAKQHRQEAAKAQQVQSAGKAAAAKPGFQRTAADKIAMKTAGLSETSYNKLNAIFESIMEAEQEENGEQVETIGQYMLDWFNSYMQGVNWKRYEQKIIPMIQNIEATYKRDKGRAAIKQLSKAAYAISGPSGAAGAQNAYQGQNKLTSNGVDFGTKSFTPTTTNDKEAFNTLDSIKKNNPKVFDQFTKMQGKK